MERRKVSSIMTLLFDFNQIRMNKKLANFDCNLISVTPFYQNPFFVTLLQWSRVLVYGETKACFTGDGPFNTHCL